MATTAPIAFAHRGGSDGGHAENSLAAFADALARGAAIETDIRLSSDGVAVLVHDGYFRRFGLPWPVRLVRAATLARYGIPSLASLYEVLGSRFELCIDVKVNAAAVPAINVPREFDAVQRLWLVHSELDVLSALRGYDPDVRLVHEAHRPHVAAQAGGATARADVVRVADTRAQELARRRVDAENRHWESWDTDQVGAMHAHDVLAFGSLVHRPDEMAAAASRGLDALYSDHVDALVAAVGHGERA